MDPGMKLFVFCMGLWILGMFSLSLDPRKEVYKRDSRDQVMPWQGGPSRKERREAQRSARAGDAASDSLGEDSGGDGRPGA